MFLGVYGNVLDAQGAKGILDSSGSSEEESDDEPQDEKARLLKKKKEVRETSQMLMQRNVYSLGMCPENTSLKIFVVVVQKKD